MNNLKKARRYYFFLFLVIFSVALFSLTSLATTPQIWIGDEDPSSTDATTNIADFKLKLHTSFNSSSHHVKSVVFYSLNEITSVAASDTEKFEPVIESKAKSNSTGVWTTRVKVELVPIPNTLNAGDEIPTTLTISFDGASAVNVPFKAMIDNTPSIDFSASLNGNVISNLWGDLVAGNTYDITADVVDRAGLLDGKELRYHWEIEAGSEFTTLSAEYTSTPAIKLTTLARGSIDFGCSIEQKSGSDWRYITGSTYSNIDIGGALRPINNSAIDTAVSAAVDRTSSINVNVGEGLNASTLSHLKSQAKAGGVDKVTLTHNGNDDVTMSFDPSELDDSFLGTFTPAFSASIPDSAQSKGISNSGQWVDFVFSGDLPAPLTITMVVDPADFPSNTTEYTVWYYNTTAGRMEEQSVPVVYNAEKHTVTFTLTHFSAYLVLEKGTNPNPAGSTSKKSKGSGIRWLPITATAGEGGSISNEGIRIFKAGEIKETYVITPDDGYSIYTVKVDGKYLTELEDGNKITLTAIYGPREIVVTFKKVSSQEEVAQNN